MTRKRVGRGERADEHRDGVRAERVLPYVRKEAPRPSRADGAALLDTLLLFGKCGE
jgi:hypothetical protein